MTITTVSYTKTFNLGSYQSEKIGIEYSLNEGENAMEALDAAQTLAQEFHEKNNPLPTLPFENTITDVVEPLQEIKIDKRTAKEKQIEKLVEDINSCTIIKVLESYRLIAKSNETLQTTYDNKLKQLQDADN